MRLTLRTLLAYLDDILVPEDSKLLAEKIRDSEFASGLVHRVRNTTRRLRLGAPPLSGKGMGLDPNTVSEYLDNALPSERVPDFERVCLESDVHLAEVASCHQVLSLVFGEAAEVEPHVRDRIYAIGNKSSTGTTTGTKAAPAAAPAKSESTAPPKEKIPAKAPPEEAASPAVPDYLKDGGEKNQTLKWFAITLVLSILIVLCALRAMGPFTNEHPLVARLFSTSKPAPQVPVENKSHAQNTAAKKKGKAQSANKSKQKSAGKKKADGTAKQKNSAGPVNSKSKTATTGKKPSSTGAKKTNKKRQPQVGGGGNSGSSVGLKGGKPSAKKKASSPPRASVKLGTFLTFSQVLARYDAAGKQWNRLPARAAIHAGDELISLPTYRPQVLLSKDVHLTVSGRTRFQVQPGGAANRVRLEVDYGRLKLMAVDRGGIRIELKLAGRSGVATLENADTELAVEVKTYVAPGLDPENSKPQRAIQLYTSSGSVSWEENGSKTTIAAKQVARFLDDDPATAAPAAALPSWITDKDLTSFDTLSSEGLRKFLVVGRPMSLCLEEQIGDRRVEVRYLTLRCLAAMGQHEPVIKAFRDTANRSIWSQLFLALQTAVRSGPEPAKQVRVALEKTRTNEAKMLYRMLWGYSSQQLKQSAAKELVEALNHDKLDIRIFAFENLRQITQVTLRYFPERQAARRRTPIFKWKDRLKKGQIDYKVQPQPFD